jgi:hypothetical protein
MAVEGHKQITLATMSQDEVEPLIRSETEQDEEDTFQRLYGAWAPLTPSGVADLMDGYERPWWIVGGWAIDAATGLPREHEDVDVSVLACDVPELYGHLKGQWHLWNNVAGSLTPLSDAHPDARDPESQIWVRAEAAAPWVMDVVLTPDRGGLWVNKRDPEHVASVEDVTWRHTDGIRYQLPEIVLLFKAALARPKDVRDLQMSWARMSDTSRAWLREQVARLYPEHPWTPLMETCESAIRAR